ncbi:MAG: VOC family protein [Lachnospiraceae bacterium]|jgi:catechol 2,3-dioxygenase-like lactoylglutathione lyase family enzyme|nr:VOC family protein [Lachnospiraceae bacterium]MBR2843371.1 VOC family protein [Lachnospiraceae bacterium]MBR3263506.1 VOC family protein [Lachnospiraceae bacterium]MBR3361119.1 VOC family protein [Lachnospiraceae bacterium]MBR6356800.1 VOC family protein [Lachnospiraceae bacterium]
MGGKLTKVLHTGISTYNIEESIEWYRKELGFELVEGPFYAPPLKAKLAFIEWNGYQIELFEYDEPKKIPEDRLLPNTDLQTVGTKHVCFAIDSFDDIKERFQKEGVEIVHEVNMGDDRVMFIHDCNGVLIELIQKPE